MIFEGRKKGIKKGILSLVVLSMGLLTACGGSSDSSASSKEGSAAQSIQLSIATHQPGIFYHTTGSAIAGVVSEKHPSINVTVRPYAGTTAWMSLVNNNQVNLGITEAANMRLALEGAGDFQRNANIRALIISGKLKMSGYTVRKDSGINSLSDLKGKRVATGYNGDMIIQSLLNLQLQSVGLTWDDVKKVPVTDVGSGLNALRENRVDAVFTGNPTVGAFLEADDAIGIKALNLGNIAPEQIDQFPKGFREEMDKQIPTLEPVVYKGGFIKEDTVIYEYPVGIATSTHLSEEVGYELVKTLWENYEALHRAFGWFESWTPETMYMENPPVPYHDGAIKFFKEKGLWTDEAEKNHQELLKLTQ